MNNWVAAQRRQIRKLNDSTLRKELAFAEAFKPPVSWLEVAWLDELKMEIERRLASREEEKG